MADDTFAGQPPTLNIKFKPHEAPMSVRPNRDFFTNISNRIQTCSGQRIDPRLLAGIYTAAIRNATGGGEIFREGKKLWVSYPQVINNTDIASMINVNVQPSQEISGDLRQIIVMLQEQNVQLASILANTNEIASAASDNNDDDGAGGAAPPAARLRTGPRESYSNYIFGCVLCLTELADSLRCLASNFSLDNKYVPLNYNRSVSLPALMNLISAALGHDQILNPLAADIQERLLARGTSDTSVTADIDNLFQNHPIRSRFEHLDIEGFTDLEIQQNHDVTPGPKFLSYRGERGDYVVIGKVHYFRNPDTKQPDYSYFVYFNKCRVIVYVSTWTTHRFEQNERTIGDDGNPIPVHCWWISDANKNSEEAFDNTIIHRIFCNPRKTGQLNLVSLAKIHNYEDTSDSTDDGGGKQPPSTTPKKKKRSFSSMQPLTVDSD